MLKRCNISWLMGFENEAYLFLLFHYTEQKRFSTEHTKNLNANDRACPDVTFWAVGYHSPLPPPPPPPSPN